MLKCEKQTVKSGMDTQMSWNKLTKVLLNMNLKAVWTNIIEQTTKTKD